MNELLINGSPHKNGCTNAALAEVAKTLNEAGIETTIFHIGAAPVGGCVSCGGCGKAGKCGFGGPGGGGLPAGAKPPLITPGAAGARVTTTLRAPPDNGAPVGGPVGERAGDGVRGSRVGGGMWMRDRAGGCREGER